MNIERTDEEIIDDFLAHPGYELVCNEYNKIIYQMQAGVLDTAQNWDNVVEARGIAKVLAEFINLRENRAMIAMAESTQEGLFSEEAI